MSDIVPAASSIVATLSFTAKYLTLIVGSPVVSFRRYIFFMLPNSTPVA